MKIVYAKESNILVEEVIEHFNSCGYPHESDQFDDEQVEKLIAHSKLVVTARDNGKLVGIAFSITDFTSTCFISDLAVRPEYRRHGCGEELVTRSHELAGGEKVRLVSVSNSNTVDYFKTIGMEKCDDVFIIPPVHRDKQ